jgi:Family of unknown function (DUF6508)
VMCDGTAATLRERLHALAAFLPEFEKPGFEFGQWVMPPPLESGVMIMAYFTEGPVADSLYRICYDMGWVLQGFDWPAWMNTTEATQLRDNPSVLERATFEQLARLLTVLNRQDRFVEGTLASAYKDGLLVRILRRAASLEADLMDDAT